MSGAIGREAGFWLYAAGLGAELLLLYDLLRIIRRVVPHRLAAIGLEDFCYWMVSGILIFRMLYRFNYGIIRWFAVFGMLAGMLLYHLTLSGPLVKGASRLLQKLLRWIGKPFGIIFHKIRKILGNFVEKIKKITIYLKKKLKRRKKNCSIESANYDRSGEVGKAKSQKKKKTSKAAEQTDADQHGRGDLCSAGAASGGVCERAGAERKKRRL